MKNILLISGGNDSMMIHEMLKETNLDLIYFDYGQPYLKEEIKRLPKNTKIKKIAKLEIEDSGYVKGRNFMFLFELRKLYDKGCIFMGSNKDDIFPDNNERFLKRCIQIINKSFKTKLKIKLPLKNMTKKEILKYVNQNKLNTYSCYKGGVKPCGKCKACLSVKNATKNS